MPDVEFTNLLVVAETNLSLGRNVVVDTVNDSEPARQTWRTAASSTRMPLRFVLLTMTDMTEHRRRLEGRVRGLANVREPTWGEVLNRAQSFEPWSGDHEVVNSDRPVSEVVREVLARLQLP